MCFTIDKNHKKPITAKMDIECYKAVLVDEKTAHRNFVYSPNTLYKQNKFWALKNFISGTILDNSINEGFHSYYNLNKAKRCYGYSDYYKMIKCIIPKGAKYFKNPETEEYVSNQLIYDVK